jgi:hypothetical protein
MGVICVLSKFKIFNVPHDANQQYTKDTGWTTSWRRQSPPDLGSNPRELPLISPIRYLDHGRPYVSWNRANIGTYPELTIWGRRSTNTIPWPLGHLGGSTSKTDSRYFVILVYEPKYIRMHLPVYISSCIHSYLIALTLSCAPRLRGRLLVFDYLTCRGCNFSR